MSKYTPFTYLPDIKFKHNIIDFSTPIVMGILNLSNDSFYDGGKYNSNDKIIAQCRKMLVEGADIIDIGAYSSRPGSSGVTKNEELQKIIAAVKLIREEFPKAILSVDTFRSIVAKKAIEAGADIINDISAGELDHQMVKTIAELDVPYIIMHMKGNPQNMQKNPYYKDVSTEVFTYLEKKIEKLKNEGIKNIIIDPGFGFGKTLEHNYELLNKINILKKLNVPVLIGTSRKSMIYKLLNITPEKAINGTTITHIIALQKGVNILRAHDVAEAVECIKMFTFAKDLS